MSQNIINAGLAPQFLAAETLRTLVPVLAPIKSFAVCDFSGYVAEKGQTVSTRFAGKSTASTFNSTDGFVAEDAVSNTVTVTLADHRYVMKSFTDLEAATISVEMLRRVWMAPIANAVVKSIYDDVLGATTAANYSNTAYSGAKSSFNRVAVANVATSLTKANLPFENRAALLSPDAFGQLLQDASVAQYLSIGDVSVIRDGKVGRLHGLDIYEYAAFPSSGTAFTEGLNGIATSGQGVCIVSRVPVAPVTGGGEALTVEDNDSKFAFQMRQWYDWTRGKTNISASWITGHSVGNPDALQRIAFTS
jgi:hypothetical protein